MVIFVFGGRIKVNLLVSTVLRKNIYEIYNGVIAFKNHMLSASHLSTNLLLMPHPIRGAHTETISGSAGEPRDPIDLLN